MIRAAYRRPKPSAEKALEKVALLAYIPAQSASND
jgi:hypothetical protein